jgi:hypothetical protein
MNLASELVRNEMAYEIGSAISLLDQGALVNPFAIT